MKGLHWMAQLWWFSKPREGTFQWRRDLITSRHSSNATNSHPWLRTDSVSSSHAGMNVKALLETTCRMFCVDIKSHSLLTTNDNSSRNRITLKGRVGAVCPRGRGCLMEGHHDQGKSLRPRADNLGWGLWDWVHSNGWCSLDERGRSWKP